MLSITSQAKSNSLNIRWSVTHITYYMARSNMVISLIKPLGWKYPGGLTECHLFQERHICTGDPQNLDVQRISKPADNIRVRDQNLYHKLMVSATP